MKKWLLCFVLLLSGCKNGYTVIRNPESDTIKLGLVVSEKDKYLIEDLDLNVQFVYVCNLDCMSRFRDLEEDYVDGIVLVGEEVNQSFESFKNKNHIPTISAYREDPFIALKKMYPEYKKWEHVTNKIMNKKADAYYIDEGLNIKTNKPFYQKNHPQSLCELTEDKQQLQNDLNQRIEYFIHSNNTSSSIMIEWTKK